MLHFQLLSLVALLFLYKDILEFVFLKLTKRMFYFNMFHALDFGLITAVGIWYYRDYTHWQPNVPEGLSGGAWDLEYTLT